jgi:hypothetical protein
MGYASDPAFAVLFTVRLKGFADADAVAVATGMPLEEVEEHLQAAAAAGRAVRREGRLTGWSVTSAGREHVNEAVQAELEAAGVRDTVERAYREFLVVNPELLAVCTDWQLRMVDGKQVPNDHSDTTYDKEVVSRLRQVDDAVQPVCDALEGALERFRRYGPRLSTALTKVESGEVEWFTKPMIDSYHTVWFELHEDLLATLGIERGSEGT